MTTDIQFLLYNLPEEQGKVQVIIKDETIWCTQKAMAQLFGVQRPAITKHLGNIFNEGELDSKVVCSKMEHTTEHGAIEGKPKPIIQISTTSMPSLPLAIVSILQKILMTLGEKLSNARLPIRNTL
nr:hypothetical protein Prevot99_1480 [uncultured Prevotella sp.]